MWFKFRTLLCPNNDNAYKIMYLFGTTTRLGKAVECVREDFFESAYFLRTYHCLREYCLEEEISRIITVFETISHSGSCYLGD